jgi:hypothetical protein
MPVVEPRYCHCHRHFYGRQHCGAVLAVCLLLLTCLTLLAVATLRAAALELTMAGNAHYMSQAFELAQTGLTVAVAGINDNTTRLVADEGWTDAIAARGEGTQAGHAYEVSVRYLYRGAPPPDAVSNEAPGSEPNPTEAFFFELTAIGTTHARGAKSVQTRGFWIPAENSRPVRLTYWFPHAET